MRRRRTVLMFLTVVALASAGTLPASARPSTPAVCTRWTDPDATGPALGGHPRVLADRCLHLNQIQALGTHNSYHVQVIPTLFNALRAFDPALAASLEYTHSPLAEQFESEGIRQIELDVFADPDGGLFDTRHALPFFGLPADSGIPELEQPGFKVLHVQEIDFETRCYTFVSCLRDVKEWSDANGEHVPIAILVELKDDPIPDPVEFGFVQPHPIGPAELDALDAEIRSVFPPERIITPDSVRGTHATLEEAILSDGWPTLGATRGKVMFLMDNGGSDRTNYLAGHPGLRGRVLFTNAEPGQPDAAFVKRNDPLGANVAQIQDLVRRGYVVRTRADADTVQARTGDTTQRDAAFASGAQWVSTDYPVPGRAAPLGSDYVAELPGAGVVRCNPVNTGPACRDRAIE